MYVLRSLNSSHDHVAGCSDSINLDMQPVLLNVLICIEDHDSGFSLWMDYLKWLNNVAAVLFVYINS